MEIHLHPHPALALADQARIDYFIVVATLVLADGRVDDAEMARLRAITAAAELHGPAADQVMAAARLIEPAHLTAILERIKPDRALAEALLTDALVVVFADRHVDGSEAAEVRVLAERLGFSAVHAALLARHVETTLAEALGSDGEGGERAHTLARDLAAGLAAAAPPSKAAAAIRWLYQLVRRES